jgi:hypothetical protein
MLPFEFVSKGHKHEQIRRTAENENGQFALYHRWSIATEWTTPAPHYEVIRVRQSEAGTRMIDGREINYEDREVYPNEKSWGVDGWTFQTREKADQKYLALIRRHGKRSMG